MNFTSSQEFSTYIERLAQSKNISYIEAILHYCEKNSLDPVDVAPQISRSLRGKLENDFRNIHMLPRLAQLDI